MKRAATIGLAMTLITLNATLFSAPAVAQGLLGDLVKDTLGTAAGIVGGVVGGAANITAGAVSGAANIVSGTVDATGNVLDASGRVVGRVVLEPTTSTVVPGWTVVSPGSTTTTTAVVPGSTTTTTRVYTFGSAPTVFGATLDTRISDLRNAINVAETQGKLTSAQAATMRADLDRIATSYITVRNNNTLTFPGALTVARDLDAFNTRLATTLSLQPYTPLVVTTDGSERILVSSAVIPGANTTLPGAIANTTGNVVGGVIGGVGNVIGGTVGGVIGGVGSLLGGTIGAAGNIVQSTVNATGDVIDTSGRVIGTIVPGSFDAAVTPTTTGSTRMVFGTTTNVLSTNLDLRLADMHRVIAEYQMAGRISPAQASELTLMLDRVSTTLASQRAGGRTLTFDEAVAMARDLDAASVRLGSFVGTSPFSPMVIVQEGSPRMMILTRSGAVSSVPTTTVGGTTVIGTGSVPTNAVAVLPILDARRLELDRIISQGVSSKAITAAEAARLTAELNGIATKIGAGIKAGPTFTIDQVVPIATTLDEFNTRIATTTHVSALPPLTVSGSTGPVLSTSVFGNTIGLQAVEPTIWFNTLSGRRAELETFITTGISGGHLTEQQATELRAELNRINTLIEGARTAGTITYTTALPIAMNLDVLGNRIRTQVTSVNFVPLIANGRISFVGGTYSPIDELSLRRAEVGAAIDRERFLGRLTVQEAQRLQYKLGNIGQREEGFRKDGVLTYSEVTIIHADLNRISAELNQLVANRRGTVSVR
jgi:hypothetical protein